MIDYLVPEFFVSPSPGGSGGMHTKVDRVRRAVSSIYRLHVGSDLSEMQSDFLLIEPLYFRMSEMFEAEDDSEDPDFHGGSPIDRPFQDQGHRLEGYLEALSAHPATKILYCSEMELFRWTGWFRKALLEICNVVTCNCDYQASLFSAVGIENPWRLIDPIPEEDFVPSEKRLKVVAMGRISEFKGSPFIAELFKRLSPLPVETVYVGGATLWGDASDTDMEIEGEIKEHADYFVQNAYPADIPKLLADATYFVGSSIHDVFSSCHAEALMSGCVSLGGEHPIYSERPGFSGYTDPGAVIDTIKRQTQHFKSPADSRIGDAARAWALTNVSFDTFLKQLICLLRPYYE